MIIRHLAIALCTTVFVSGWFSNTASADISGRSPSPAAVLGVPGAQLIEIPEFDENLPSFNIDASVPQNTTFNTVTITQEAVDARIAAGDTGPIIDMAFTIEGLTHSHLSDLTVRLRHVESNRVATLFERVGITDPSPGGIIDNQNVDGTGDTSNFSGSYRFRDEAGDSERSDDLWLVASLTADDAVIPTLVTSDNSFLPTYEASGANNGDVTLFNAFGVGDNGESLTLQSVVGDWRFEISDRSNQTPVTDVPPALVQSFTQTNVFFDTAVVAIPEPTTASGMLFALIGLAARRRRA